MKTLIGIVILMTISFVDSHAFHFEKFSDTIRIKTDKSLACDSTSIFMLCTEKASYAGGVGKLESDLNGILDFKKLKTGRTYIQIIVNCKSKAVAFKPIKGIEPNTDSELIEKLKTLQNWKAGKQNDNEVDFIFMLRFIVEKKKLIIEEISAFVGV